MSNVVEWFRRPHAAELARRLAEPRRFVQVVAGARQVGKTTLVQQVVQRAEVPARFASADEPALRGTEWVTEQSRRKAPLGELSTTSGQRPRGVG